MTARLSSNIKCARAKEHLAQRIVSGEFIFGSRFPGLNDLCKEYNLSYVTLCKAVKMLENDGYLRRKTGVGYFVCYPGNAAANVKKKVNIISSKGYYESYRCEFDEGIGLFEKKSWQVNLLLSDDLYSLTPQINSPDAFSIITAFNINWKRFAATFGHIARRAVVLGRLSGNPDIASIVADEVTSIRMCMEHFAATGRKKVALATVLPRSELESLRIAAWRNIIESSGLSFDWMRRHLFSLSAGNDELSLAGQCELLKKYLRDNVHDTEALILPAPSQSFIDAADEAGIRIPEDLAVVAIGGKPDFLRKNPGAFCLDNNFAGHFRVALDILEDRFAYGDSLPGAWNFCPPGGIIPAADIDTVNSF